MHHHSAANFTTEHSAREFTTLRAKQTGNMDSKENHQLPGEKSKSDAIDDVSVRSRGICVGLMVLLFLTTGALVVKTVLLEQEVNNHKHTLGIIFKRLDELENRREKSSFVSEQTSIFGGRKLLAIDGTSQCTCPPGPKGNQGERGERGRSGRTGKSGDTGDTGPAGLDGSKGERGLKGDKGENGERGERGLEGTRGVKGELGDTGQPGSVGQKGSRGIKGNPGPRGPNGPAGPKGNIGRTGPRGATGKTGNYTLKDEDGSMISTGTLRAIHLRGTGGDNWMTGKTNLGALGGMKKWEVATTTGGFDLKSDGNVTVTDKGHYYIYNKILFYDNKAFFAAETRINGVPYLKCSGQRAVAAQRFGSCTSNGIASLEAGDEVGIKSVYPYSFVDIRNEASYFGLIKLN